MTETEKHISTALLIGFVLICGISLPLAFLQNEWGAVAWSALGLIYLGPHVKARIKAICLTEKHKND